MSWKYPVLLRIQPNSDLCVLVPDLEIKSNVNYEDINSHNGVIKYIEQVIKNKIALLQKKGFILKEPSKIDDYAHLKMGNYDMWSEIDVNVAPKKKKKLFAYAFPAVAFIFRTLSVLLFSLMGFFAMHISTNNHAVGYSLGILLPFCGFMMAMTMYIFSNASTVVSQTGEKIDDLIFCPCKDKIFENAIIQKKLLQPSTMAKVMKTLSYIPLGAFAITDSVSFGITSAQAINALGEKLRSNNTLPLSTELIMALSIIMLVSAGVSSLAFDAGFVIDAANFIGKRIDKCSKSSYDAEESIDSTLELISSEDHTLTMTRL